MSANRNTSNLANAKSVTRHCDVNSKFMASFDERSNLIFNTTSGWIDLLLARTTGGGNGELILPKVKVTQNHELDKWTHVDEAAYLLRFIQNSNGRLSPSLALFKHMMAVLEICPTFRELVTYFGFKRKEYEYSSPSVHYASNDTQTVECLYSFRYAEDNGQRDPGKDPWSIRQTAIYQRYSFNTAKVIWVGVGASQEAEALIHSHLKGGSQRSSISDIFTLHASLMKASLADWRGLLLDVKKRVQKLNDNVAVAEAGEWALGLPKDFKIDFGERKKLNLLHDKVCNVRVALQSSITTIKALRRDFEKVTVLNLPSANFDCLIGVLDECLDQASIYLAEAEIIDAKVKEAATLLLDFLSHNDTVSLRDDSIAMRKMSEQATEDSRSIKLITIITAIFLPATVTASFFSTQFVQVGGGSFQLEHSVWIYFAATIVLTLIVVACALSPKLVLLMGRRFSASASGRKDEASAETEADGDPIDHTRKLSSQTFIVRLLRIWRARLPKQEQEKADAEIESV